MKCLFSWIDKFCLFIYFLIILLYCALRLHLIPSSRFCALRLLVSLFLAVNVCEIEMKCLFGWISLLCLFIYSFVYIWWKFTFNFFIFYLWILF